jgi:hypothetical protein
LLGTQPAVSLAELRDNSAGKLTVGANESTSLLPVENFHALHPKNSRNLENL